ncbi:MAG TPA: hypothetical protein VHY30_08310 [Verrucomicrobiae bacterium]|nr:hypothetical protein [Verrucomicrobiae bacterium]
MQERKTIPLGKFVLRDIKSFEQKNVGKEARVTLELENSRAVIIEWVLKASQVNVVTSYHASLLIDSQRIRGVDYCPIERKKFFKTHIPKGWHENVLDPNTGEDRHEPLDIGTISDFEDFCGKVAKRWNIDYQKGETLF